MTAWNAIAQPVAAETNKKNLLILQGMCVRVWRHPAVYISLARSSCPQRRRIPAYQHEAPLSLAPGGGLPREPRGHLDGAPAEKPRGLLGRTTALLPLFADMLVALSEIGQKVQLPADT